MIEDSRNRGIDFLQCLLRIECLPPGVVVLQVLLEPGKLGLEPGDALVVFGHTVILAFDADECGLAAKELEGGEHLDGVVDGHVGVLGAMEEEDRGMNLVDIVDGRMLDIEVGLGPRIAVGH